MEIAYFERDNLKTKHLVAVSMLALAASAIAALPPAKVQELQAKGISNWTPGQNRGQQPVFSTLPQARPAALPRDTQTMTYDDGNLTALPTTFGQVYGNRFKLGIGGVELNTLTVQSFQFYFLEDSLPDTNLFFQIASPSTMTGSINALASVNVAGLMNSGPSFSAPVLNTIAGTALGGASVTMQNDTFYLGGWCLNSNTGFPVTNEVLGLATNGPRQEGYTAASGTGPVLKTQQAFNTILRAHVTSMSLVPVELMTFGIE